MGLGYRPIGRGRHSNGGVWGRLFYPASSSYLATYLPAYLGLWVLLLGKLASLMELKVVMPRIVVATSPSEHSTSGIQPGVITRS